MSQNLAPGSSSSSSVNKNGSDKCNVNKSNHNVSKRLQGELLTLMKSKDKTVSAFPEGENLFKWIGTIEGASGTVFEGFTFKLSLEMSSNYPYSPPTVKFVTPCFHPNVDQAGNICLDILKEEWSAMLDVQTVLISIQSLLGEPNNKSPLNGQAAEMWKNQAMYRKYLLEHYKKEC